MTRIRTKFLAASAVALAAADTGSAQFFRSSTGRGVAAVTGVGSPYGYNTGYGSGYYQNGMYRSSPQVNGWNGQGYNTFGQQTVVGTPGVNYYPSTTGYSTMTPTAGMPTNGFVQPVGYNGNFPAGVVVQSGGYVTGTSNGVVTANQYGVPQQTGVVQTAGTMMMPQGMASGQTVTTQVIAPDGATVTLSGTAADRTQGVRVFNSPPLDPNKTYTYVAKATWTDPNGKPMTREKSVDVRAGQQVTVDLTKADAGDRSNDNSRNQSEDQTPAGTNKSSD